MSQFDAVTSRRVALASCVLFGLSGVVMASRPEPLTKADSCGAIDPVLLLQAKPTHGPHDEPAGAAFDRAITMMSAARSLCDRGDVKGAQKLYRRAGQALTGAPYAFDDER